MLVRLALESDFPALLEMVRANIAETSPHLPFDEEVALETGRSYLRTASPTIFVCERRR